MRDPKPFGLNELREMFLKFFETKEHLRLPSFSLIPQNDASLLLINSGMAPMKPWFTGEQEPPRHRVCTCQKCIRTGDIENIGKTARHGTYFEMLGNFSFGDYFKKDAIHWAWEFLTSPEWVGLDPERLYPSVFAGNETTPADDEAFAIWRDEIGIPEDRIFKFGKEDNFWEHGSGPCGPCSEIYYDRGPEWGCGKPGCTVGCDCDRYIEVWNIVFSQFDNDGEGHYTELKQKNIDTGMGLERLACVCQKVPSLFDVDTVMNITHKVTELTGASYGQSHGVDVSPAGHHRPHPLRHLYDLRRRAPLQRGPGLCAAPPAAPGRPPRQAAGGERALPVQGVRHRHPRERGPLPRAAGAPGLYHQGHPGGGGEFRQDHRRRPENFQRHARPAPGEGGEGLLRRGRFQAVRHLRLPHGSDPGDGGEEQGMTLDEKAFHSLMEEQRQRARKAREALGDLGWAGVEFGKDVPETEFVGYESNSITGAKVVALVVENEQAEELMPGVEGIVVLDKTPFYAEMGGQVADRGVIAKSGENGCLFTVTDVQKNKGGKYMHYGKVTEGTLKLGDTVSAQIDVPRRNAVRRAHTATHLLHKALQTVLGSHVHQAGSLVEPDYLRFDFTHFSAMTAEELSEVSRIVNESILEGYSVDTKVMGIEEAKQTGATALFGEKYGDQVRVVDMGGYSVEFCGGTHLDNTAKVGVFHISSEFSVASGVRRIEATTGLKSLEVMNRNQELLFQAAAL